MKMDIDKMMDKILFFSIETDRNINLFDGNTLVL